MEIYRDSTAYRKYTRAYEKLTCPACKNTFYRSPDDQDRVRKQEFCCQRRKQFCPSCFERVPKIPGYLLTQQYRKNKCPSHLCDWMDNSINRDPYFPKFPPKFITDVIGKKYYN